MKPLAQTTYKGKPVFQVRFVYQKPALGEFEAVADRVASLKFLTKSLSMQIRKHIQSTSYSQKAKSFLNRVLQVRSSGNRISISATHPAFRPLIMGQPRHQMRWLVKARAPIPIVTDSGELIFRWATAKSMANGKWIHPGRPSTGVIRKARNDAVQALRKTLRKEMRHYLENAFQQR